jgi:small redox-active disulfide protein 2
MKIVICGPGCASCEKAKKTVEQAVRDRGIDAIIEKETDFAEMAKMGIFSTPAVVIDGEVKCVGRAPERSEVDTWLS